MAVRQSVCFVPIAHQTPDGSDVLLTLDIDQQRIPASDKVRRESVIRLPGAPDACSTNPALMTQIGAFRPSDMYTAGGTKVLRLRHAVCPKVMIIQPFADKDQDHRPRGISHFGIPRVRTPLTGELPFSTLPGPGFVFPYANLPMLCRHLPCEPDAGETRRAPSTSPRWTTFQTHLAAKDNRSLMPPAAAALVVPARSLKCVACFRFDNSWRQISPSGMIDYCNSCTHPQHPDDCQRGSIIRLT